MMNGFDDFQKLGRDNTDAAMRSAGALTRGFQTLATEAAAFSRQSFEAGTAAFEKLLGVSSVDKAVEVQSTFAQLAYNSYVDQVTKVGGIVAEMASEAYKPYEGLFARFGK
jgi:hypothetical protein